jgi:8-oxo-dGTP pyrophosphatase MutT (NUDIX family)
MTAALDGYLRHIRACNNAEIPGDRVAFRITGQHVGWVQPVLAETLARFPEIQWRAGGLDLTAPERLIPINRELSERGFFRWRREAFDIRGTPEGPVLALLDRGALPAFGVVAVGVHVNGLVHRTDGLHVWVGRRAADKALDPNKLDHIVAGGVPAGLSPWQCLIKEAEEEAAIPADIAAQAREVGLVTYAMERPEGLRRDRLHCYDLELPEDFIPRPNDDEVQEFQLWHIERVRDAVRDTDEFKFNVNLVLIDLLLRQRMLPQELRAALG